MTTEQELSEEELAIRRAKYLTGLLWHVGAFVINNLFLWLLDLLLGQEGLQWAYWVTVPWGVALSFHALAWFIDGRQIERRRTKHYLQEERGTAR